MAQFTFMLLLFAVISIHARNQECSENEKYRECGKMCEPSCANRNPKPILCPGLVCSPVTSACRCDKGYLRNSNKKCVLPADCESGES